jgi:hypothetical protein
MARDVSDSVTIRGQGRTVLGAVLDVDTALIVQMLPGTSVEDVLQRVLKGALVRPAAPLAKTVPQQLIAPPECIQAVRSASTRLSKLTATAISEGHALHEAEEIVDALVGHMEGRDQPEEPPTVDDWRLLYRELAAFTDAAPWQRWSDDDWFHGRFELDGAAVERDCVVLGNAGLQHGFNAMPDANNLLLASDSYGDSDSPLEHLHDALIVHLDPWRETRGMYADKARRYAWPSQARFVPSLLTVRQGGPADLSRGDARLLALALHGVVTQDARRLVPAGEGAAVTGELVYADGTVGRFAVDRP